MHGQHACRRAPRLARAPSPAEVEDPYITVLVRVQDLSPEEREELAKLPTNSWPGHPADFPTDSVIITDLRSKIERLLHRPIGR